MIDGTARGYYSGLEFPFVICYAIGEISDSLALRNALYMILTRSFLSSYLVVNAESPGVIAKYDEAAKHLETHPYLDVRLPTQEEIKRQEESLLQHARYCPDSCANSSRRLLAVGMIIRPAA